MVGYKDAMLTSPHRNLSEHPVDVFQFILDCHAENTPCVLAILTGTQGGAVRTEGALMAITSSGYACGYLSGGCIDADIILQAQNALRTGQSKTLHYGAGSPFLDITLPCGGAIEVTLFVKLNTASIRTATDALLARRVAHLNFTNNGQSYSATYRPKLRVRIAGRSADPVALARISVGTGIETELWSADEDCLANAAPIDNLTIRTLTTPSALPGTGDDASTAFVLMMHDHDWEPALLIQALSGSAFYIGAVGSPHTHAKRCALLSEHGVSHSDIARINGPIGLVPSLRDASMLAISTLAEIIDAFHKDPTVAHTPSTGALIHA